MLVGTEGLDASGTNHGVVAATDHFETIRENAKQESTTGPEPGDKRLQRAFTIAKNQTGDAHLQLDFEKDLTYVKELGEGAFGTVGLYKLRDIYDTGQPERMVAVKQIKNQIEVQSLNEQLNPVVEIQHASDEDLKVFLDEIKLMKTLKHKNLAELVGAGTLVNENDARELMFCVQEYLPYKLHSIMKKKRFTPEEAVGWCLDIARGMQYLHERKPIIIHRDLKPDNILLNEDRVANITDFGLFTVAPPKEEDFEDDPLAPGNSNPSRRKSTIHRRQTIYADPSVVGAKVRKERNNLMFADMSYTFKKPDPYKMTGMTGTLRYMAPESFRCELYDEKVDQYSFSMIMYELMTKQEPYYDKYLSPEQIASASSGGLRPKLPKEWHRKLADIHTLCWHADPSKRPTFGRIVQMLEKIQSDPLAMASLHPPALGCGSCTIA
jgi:serine/threonine protein kinase